MKKNVYKTAALPRRDAMKNYFSRAWNAQGVRHDSSSGTSAE